ncbi:hypothetical protein VitviT2T_028516 [Vitis vinifera]|uniref:ubiquitinyl hydrolase 1 n=1 Tax=Vitis vinifera TaxID=29760 RepID=A0ABY9DUE6_VITVI|nr:hypothetical protein VitviT2T_028516 [Vitis vinifera]
MTLCWPKQLGSKVRETLLWWESCPPPSSSLVSKARRLDDGFRFSNQLVVEGCGWDKIAQLKEGHPAGALGEGSHPLKTMLKDGYLLEFPQNFEAGVEDRCRGESSSRRLKVWEEGGRKYRLECRSNEVGRYLLCSVRNLEAKRFCLVFPEGKGLVGGWLVLAQKLRALGISIPALSKGDLGTSNSEKDGYRVKGKEKGKGVYAEAMRKETGELGEALWVHVGNRDLLKREEQLSCCLVGCFGDSVEVVPSLSLLKEWAYESGLSREGHAKAVRASEGVDYGAEGELGQFAMSVGRNRAALAFGGWSEPSWDSVDAERWNGLALVPVGSDLTSPFEKRSVCHLEEEGSDEGRDSEDFWEELRSVKGLWSDPWCVGGDFNLVRFLEERSRGGGLTASMRRFSEVLEDRELKKLEWTGILPRPVSDHFLVLLEGGGLKRGPSPFIFENMWLEEGFKDKMKMWWGSLKFTGTSSYILDAKLRALKIILKIWNKEEFGIIETKKGEALMQVEYWDEKEKYAALNMEECEARNGARESYKSWVMRKEIFLRQKSRELWLKEGDNNTRFFHGMANAHSRRNWMSKLKVNGCWHLEENNLKNSVVGAFQMLYSEEEGWCPSIDGLSFIGLDNSEAKGLENPFLEEEVFVALIDLGKDKALGPDGFTMAFWLFGWDVVKDEIMGFFREFHERGRFVKSLNATFLVLVPKKGGAEDLKDFRPISLVGSLYKLLAKVLANRIKKVMGKVISEPQNAFVEGRQILDAVLIANEVVDSRALVRSMGEILFLCGSNKRAVIATLSILVHDAEGSDSLKDDIMTKALEGVSIESASDLQTILRVNTYTSIANAYKRLEAMIPVFQSRMGALLFLISALLSRGLDSIQADRDDPNPPLVTAPFGHASQEIVNLLLCGQAVPNVFDGRMDLGGGMSLKGISTCVEVGFLTLLESLNFCKVGQFLKCPKWPIWVVGSESHYTVLFALDTTVQDENELEERESQIRKAFDAQDQSGGGGFISVEGFHQVLRETGIDLPPEKLDHLCGAGFIVWSEFWQVLLDLDKRFGGLKDPTGSMGKKVFDLYHFNGIAKSVLNGSPAASGSEMPIQRPRLTKLRVSVPPRWTPEEFMADVVLPSASGFERRGVVEADLAISTVPADIPNHCSSQFTEFHTLCIQDYLLVANVRDY